MIDFLVKAVIYLAATAAALLLLWMGFIIAPVHTGLCLGICLIAGLSSKKNQI